MRSIKIYAGQLLTILVVVGLMVGLHAYVKATDLETVQAEAARPIECPKDHSDLPTLPMVIDRGSVVYPPSHPYYEAFNGRYVSPDFGQDR